MRHLLQPRDKRKSPRRKARKARKSLKSQKNRKKIPPLAQLQVQVLIQIRILIKSPKDKCTVQELPTQVKALVSPKHYQKYEEILLSTTLETMTDVILCPLQHCQCPTLIDREARLLHLQENSFCVTFAP